MFALDCVARGFLDPNPHCLRAQEDKSWRFKYIGGFGVTSRITNKILWAVTLS